MTFYLGNGATVLAAFLSGTISSAAAMTSLATAMVQDGGITGWNAGLGIIAALLGSSAAQAFVVIRRLGLQEASMFFMPLASLAIVTLGTMWISLAH